MTIIPFVISSTAPVPFQAIVTLEGNQYSLTVFWNLYGQRWYFSIQDLSGNMIVTMPLIGSPLGSDINLVFNLFQTSTLIFREDSNQFEVTP